ncbi:MAG TPA: hypothetical protein VFB67_12490 [Candidatus Polarisedimenticolaceae bacterium]|nr:hypothetical protein [Candidatus Polarisedimenticolaceae bacterium]
MRALPLIAAAMVVWSAGASRPALAWTASTRLQLVDDAIKMMPPTLRTALEKRRDEVRRGMLLPMTEEDAPGHRPAWDRGTLSDSVDAAARELVAGANGHAPFDEIARRFGTLAHFVADAGFPPAAAGPDGVPRYAHFASFCETRRARFPLVFYGHDNASLARTDFRGFTSGVLERSRAEDLNLARAYAAASSWNDPVAFDDRSVPFAIASLSYSRSVTDIVQAWLAAWKLCHGDLAGTPYRGSSH